MKYIKTYTFIFSILAFTLFSGCQEWLTIEPENKVVKENFWKKQTDVELVVASTFNKTRDYVDEEFLWGEVRGDFFVPGGRILDYYQRIMEGNIFPDNKFVIWNDYYKVINQANLVLDNAPAVRDIDLKFTEEALKVIEGQMLFLRSYSLFKLAITFKDIPMPLSAYEFDHQDFQLEQTSQQDVFIQIVEDLKKAELYLPEDYLDERTFENFKGYPSKYAAKALLANIYLWMEEPQLALSKCNEILTSGKYALMSMEFWFDIFHDGNSNEALSEIFVKSAYGEANRRNDAEQGLKNLSSNSSQRSARYFAVSEDQMAKFEQDPRGILHTVAYSISTANPTLWKWFGDNNVSPRAYAGPDDRNWILYRLADVFLMKAEAAVMLDDYTTALESINMIRTRAGVTAIDISADAGKNGWYETILDERLLELAGEGKRWYDLVRIASKDNFAYKNLLVDRVMANVPLDIKVLMRSKIGNPNFWYLPIHEDEMRVNEKLIQNEFYRTN